MDSMNFVDVSCYLLFEASGDSEADSDPIMAIVGHDNSAVAVAVAVADDDAESCSCDFSDYVRVHGLKDCDVHGYDDEDDEDNEGEEEVNSYDPSWTGEEMGIPNFAYENTGKRDQKSRACVDTSKEQMNEMEKNRLFWETCLAS